jgi:hypothetical protein
MLSDLEQLLKSERPDRSRVVQLLGKPDRHVDGRGQNPNCDTYTVGGRQTGASTMRIVYLCVVFYDSGAYQSSYLIEDTAVLESAPLRPRKLIPVWP